MSATEEGDIPIGRPFTVQLVSTSRLCPIAYKGQIHAAPKQYVKAALLTG